MERILPTGSLAIIIDLQEDSVRAYERENPSELAGYGGSLFVGAHSEYMVIDTACQAAVLGIQFKPGGAFPFLNMPASELHDLHVPLETLWKADGANSGEIISGPESNGGLCASRIQEQQNRFGSDRPDWLESKAIQLKSSAGKLG